MTSTFSVPFLRGWHELSPLFYERRKVMLESYSLNVEVAANSAIPFNSTSLIKGCTVTHPSPDTINLNKCGVYMVSFDASSAAASQVQLFKDGVAQPQAQSSAGTAPSFTTLVQVDHNNSCCCACESPVSLQVRNIGTADVTFTDCNICVTKII